MRNREKAHGKKSMFSGVRAGFVCLIGMACLMLSLSGCGTTVTKYESVGTGMGTIVSQVIYANGNGDEVIQQVSELINETENEISWRIGTSVVSSINASAMADEDDSVLSGGVSEMSDSFSAGEGYVLPQDLAQEFELIWQLSADSEGAFDLTIAPVVRLWDIDTWAIMDESELAASGYDNILPTKQEIQEKLSVTGYENVVFEERDGESVIYLPEGYMLDMGAVGKGLACDRILELLSSGVTDATKDGAQEDLQVEAQGVGQRAVQGTVISLGGNILTYGEKPDNSAWKVGVVDPMNPDSYLGVLTLTGTNFVTTSGDYERYVEIDGQRYHHIIDPSTGYPADSGIRSVTILSKMDASGNDAVGNSMVANGATGNGMIGDALSTACFVLGTEKALELAEKYGVDILIVTDSGELVMSEGMEKVFSAAK